MAVSMKGTYLAVSGVCAIATVVLGFVQAFGPESIGVDASPKVQEAASEQPAAQLTVAKIDAAEVSLTPGRPLKFVRGTRDGVVDRYPMADLFDGNPDTWIETQPGERDLDFIAEFEGAGVHRITGIEYRHPAAADPDAVATLIDVIVMPEGSLEASGREVRSFTIAPEKGPQVFSIPGTSGKGVWLRIAGSESAPDLVVGEVRLITAD